MDTLLHMDANVAQLLQSADDVSYKSHRGRGSEFAGCMEDTRVNVLEDLERWADDDTAPKVCWLGGMAGIGKSSVAVTFSERMDKKLKLGASFFCSDSFRDANREAVERHKIVVIDAIDECANQSTVESLIKAVLTLESDIPLKFLIAGRPEPQIRDTFLSSPNVKVVQLHEIPKDHVQADIRRYLENSLSKLAMDEPDWPPNNDLSILLERSDKLFIYAATAMRYISDPRFDFKERLQQINALGSTRPTPSQTGPLDQLYNHIMSRAFPPSAEEWEVSRRQDLLSAVICLNTPLSKAGITSLLQTKKSATDRDLSQFLSVLAIPDKDDGKVTIFHASFRDFIVDPKRCEAHGVDPSEGHYKLTVKCLESLNTLRRNICGLPEDNIGSQPHDINNTQVIQEGLRYSCLHWASHLTVTLTKPLAVPPTLLMLLSTFVDEHLLHWFECLSVLGELESGLKSLENVREAVAVSSLQ
ncbi:hypothetical protein JB92DRAFT_2847510 [Gautieria morchelliformis]|nr:hypothetical protein JB92DRAFT_2847510 [Gautieria morchelliformis]